jgi:hypothetical protein
METQKWPAESSNWRVYLNRTQILVLDPQILSGLKAKYVKLKALFTLVGFRMSKLG